MASQHRPGAKVTLSPAAYAKNQVKRMEVVEAQLSNLPSKKNDEQASRLRGEMCSVISDVLLTDPLLALKHDCIGRLWRSCFYGPIGILRQRVSKEKKKNKDSINLPKLEKGLKKAISEAITLYDYLISNYQSKLQPGHANNTMTPGSQQSSQSQASFNDSQESQACSTDQAGVVPGLFRMYIHLGDLYRYDNKYKEAQQNYGYASKLSPGRGNPYNQIAVVAQLKDSAAPLNAMALYWYARSLLTTLEPFEISKANLDRLFQSNRDFFQKQPVPDVFKPSAASADGGGQEMPKSQRSVASRHFLSQFVDLHYSFFQGIASDKENPPISSNKKTPLPIDDKVIAQIQGALVPLSVLLRHSAFGDPLLCKMVAICAFSEAYRADKSDKVDAVATKLLARMFTLAVGTCLAERAAVGLAKIKDQPEKMGNPGKAPASVRLLLPLLLVCEYIESSPIEVEKDSLAVETREFCKRTVDQFWRSSVDVLNILSTLRGPLNLSNEDWKNIRLKEFDSLLGFSPFQSFLDDPMALSREDGYASVEEAVEVLELNSSQEPHLSSTQDSVNGRSTSEEYKVKVARLLAFGDRMADDSAKAAGRRFARNPDGSFVWKDEEEGDEDNDSPMMDMENLHDNDTQPPLAGKGGDDVLVYSVPQGGGPALLVPGMLLQTRAMGDVPESNPRSNNERSAQAPTMPFGSPAASAPPAPGLTLGVAVDPSTAHQPHVAAPAANVMPPPGFGGGGLAAMPPPAFPPAAAMPQGHVAVPQGQVPMGTNLGAMPGFAPMMGVPAPGHAAAMPPGFGQGFVPGIPQQMPQQQVPQQRYQPTLASSMHLFGGPEALKTANPFAAASMPTVDASGNMPMMDLNFGGAGPTNGNGASFLNPGASGVAESTLLGSGLLHSLFEDAGGDKTTKNPFAT